MLLVLHTLYTSSTLCTYSGEKKGNASTSFPLLVFYMELTSVNLDSSLPLSLPPHGLASPPPQTIGMKEKRRAARDSRCEASSHIIGEGEEEGRSCPPPFFFSSGNGHLWSGDPGNDGIKVRSSHPPPILLPLPPFCALV